MKNKIAMRIEITRMKTMTRTATVVVIVRAKAISKLVVAQISIRSEGSRVERSWARQDLAVRVVIVVKTAMQAVVMQSEEACMMAIGTIMATIATGLMRMKTMTMMSTATSQATCSTSTRFTTPTSTRSITIPGTGH